MFLAVSAQAFILLGVALGLAARVILWIVVRGLFGRYFKGRTLSTGILPGLGLAALAVSAFAGLVARGPARMHADTALGLSVALLVAVMPLRSRGRGEGPGARVK